MITDSSSSAALGAPSRIPALDVLRGVAVLGILIMNIQSFSMVDAAYLNPAAYGNLDGVNRWVWFLSHVLADQKFMTLFCLLFGAGVWLMSRKVAAAGQSPARAHYLRAFWLLVFGLSHAWLFWYGDILAPYAVCALVVYLFRNRQPVTLVILGLIALAIPSAIFWLAGISMPYWPPDALQEVQNDWAPAAARISADLAAYRSSWLEQIPHRIKAAVELETFVFAIWYGWRGCGLMLIGMALLKWGVLTGERSRRFYVAMLAAGFALGVPWIVYGVTRNFANNWSLRYSMFQGSQFNYWGSLLVALGYLGAVMLWLRSGWWTPCRDALAAVGRMALTNYLGQTLICTTLFYGHGLGLYGRVERWQQALMVAGIWAVQIIGSMLWLQRFHQGPLEWLWRCLTYWRVLPIQLEAAPKRALAASQ